MISLIDGDVIVYAAGFASDAAARSVGDEKEPLPFCLHGVDTMIDAIVRDSGGMDYTIFLSGSKSFRKDAYPEYKANRDEAHKPKWYREIKEHLLRKHSAQVADDGMEADDALGIAQCTSPLDTVICTIDKDLDMIPGLHYNWSKKRRDAGVYRVTSIEAFRFFSKQLITGDSTDNIPGLWKHSGKKATAKYTSPLDDMVYDDEMLRYVYGVYEGDIEFLSMTSPLLWIKRDDEEIEWEELWKLGRDIFNDEAAHEEGDEEAGKQGKDTAIPCVP